MADNAGQRAISAMIQEAYDIGSPGESTYDIATEGAIAADSAPSLRYGVPRHDEAAGDAVLGESTLLLDNGKARWGHLPSANSKSIARPAFAAGVAVVLLLLVMGSRLISKSRLTAPVGGEPPISDKDQGVPYPKEGERDPEPNVDSRNPQPKEDEQLPQPKEDEQLPQPKEDEQLPQPKEDGTVPKQKIYEMKLQPTDFERAADSDIDWDTLWRERDGQADEEAKGYQSPDTFFNLVRMRRLHWSAGYCLW